MQGFVDTHPTSGQFYVDIARTKDIPLGDDEGNVQEDSWMPLIRWATGRPIVTRKRRE